MKIYYKQSACYMNKIYFHLHQCVTVNVKAEEEKKERDIKVAYQPINLPT